MENEILAQTKTLFVSAGHSYKDPGAVGNGLTEADIVLEFRNMVADELRQQITFSLDTSKEIENLPLREAVKMAVQHDVAVEFHCNASDNPRATGVETLSDERDFLLGNLICSTISKTLGISNRGAKNESSGQHSRLAFISDGGGIIVELFFLSNPDDLAAYFRMRYDLAAAVAGVLADSVSGEW